MKTGLFHSSKFSFTVQTSKDLTYYKMSGSERLLRNSDGPVMGLRSWITRSSGRRFLCVFNAGKEQWERTLQVHAQSITVRGWTKPEILQSNYSGRNDSLEIFSTTSESGSRVIHIIDLRSCKSVWQGSALRSGESLLFYFCRSL